MQSMGRNNVEYENGDNWGRLGSKLFEPLNNLATNFRER